MKEIAVRVGGKSDKGDKQGVRGGGIFFTRLAYFYSVAKKLSNFAIIRQKTRVLKTDYFFLNIGKTVY